MIEREKEKKKKRKKQRKEVIRDRDKDSPLYYFSILRQRNRAGLPLPGFLDCSGYLAASLALSSANRASMSRSAWTFSASRTAAL